MQNSKPQSATIARTILYMIASLFAVFSFVTGVLWFFHRPFWFLDKSNFEPATVIFGSLSAAFFALGKFLAWMASRHEETDITLSEKQAQRNRRAMLELVKKIWVEGFLKNSLHNEVLIRLGLEERKDAIERPWDMVLQIGGQPNRPLPPGTRIIDVFNEMQQSLLILGEPGSGKTTMLLELARDTINQAEQDPGQPIPMVFNLSSWTNPKQSLVEWLVNELNTKYFIPTRIAQYWVEHDDLALLLDGLDEVALERRETCVDAINVFRREHLVPLVVCSRIADYETLNTKLRLQGAVLIQPLTMKQINQYLKKVGPQLEAVRITLKNDPTLQELATSPLMLSIMTMAYQGKSVQEISTPGSMEARRAHLFNTYIQKMLKHRGFDKRYSPTQVVSWLKWLAQRTLEKTLTVLFIEDIQPDWLQTRPQRQVYKILLLIICSLIWGLIWGLSSGLIIGIMFGLSVGLIMMLIADIIGEMSNEIKRYEVLKWSGEIFKENLRLGLSLGLSSGLFVGLGAASIVELSVVPIGKLIIGLVFGLGVGLSFGLNVGVILGLIKSSGELEVRTIPNQGIRLSAKNAVHIALILGPIVGMIFGLAVGLIWGLNSGLSGGLIFGLILGLIDGFLIGGISVIQHFTLRFILSTKGYIPWSLVRFLDYAAGRVFLRKVGGGYTFIHRLLMEHFANLETEQINSILEKAA